MNPVYPDRWHAEGVELLLEESYNHPVASDGALMPSTHGLPKRHLLVIAVLERFLAEAERKGDAILAEALNLCMLNMAGGNLHCPMGALIIEASISLDKPVGAYLPAPNLPSAPSTTASAPAAPLDGSTLMRKTMEQRETVLKLLTLLETDARQRGDKELLEALHACDEITEHHACPLRLLIMNAPRPRP